MKTGKQILGTQEDTGVVDSHIATKDSSVMSVGRSSFNDPFVTQQGPECYLRFFQDLQKLPGLVILVG